MFIICPLENLHQHNGMLFDNKKNELTDMNYKIDKSWKHYAEWKKPVTKDYASYDFYSY